MTTSPRIKTAMFIDDAKFDQKLYQRIVARSGIIDETLSFLYADEALEYLKAHRHQHIDVIFLDINMPRMNGFEFLEAAARDLGDDFARLLVVMLTTSLERSDRERALSFPIVRGFINKPLTVDILHGLATSLFAAPEAMAFPGSR